MKKISTLATCLFLLANLTVAFAQKPCFPEAGMSDPELEKAILVAFKAQGWAEQPEKVIILSTDWGIRRHESTGIITGRGVNALVYSRKKTKCIKQDFNFVQSYDGSGYSKSVRMTGIGNQDKVDCTCLDGATSAEVSGAQTTEATAPQNTESTNQTTTAPKKNTAPAPTNKKTATQKNSIPDGPYESKDESGQLQQTGAYKNQKKQGLWKTYDNGKVYLEENFLDGVKNGMETKFSDAGAIDYKREYLAGEITKEQFFENGTLKSNDVYVGGKKNGKCTSYYSEGGKYQEETYVNGVLSGEKISYSNKGLPSKIETFKDDKLNGPCKKYTDGKLKEEGNYLNGMQDGVWKKYDTKTGKVIETKTYKDGVPQ